MWKKADDWLIIKTENMVKKWVKRKKYEKHKYDFMILTLLIRAILFAMNGIYLAWDGFSHHQSGSMVVAIIVSFLIGVFIAFEYLNIRDKKESYDYLFERRKNPTVYNMVKAITDDRKENEYSFRKLIFGVLAVIIILSIISPSPFIILIGITQILDAYVNCAFDFDEPEEKQEEKKESLTEVLAARWRETVGSLTPNPNGTS